MIIYLITNKVNGKRYVGLTTMSLERRWKQHCACARWGTKMFIARAIRKYGPAAFLVEQIGSASSVEGLKQMETECIRSYNTLSPHGYNLTTGGEQATPVEDVRRRIGEAQKGAKNHRFGKPNKVNLGRTFPEDVRKKVGAASARHWATIPPESRHPSDETRKRMREAFKYRPPLSKEARAKIGQALKGRPSYVRTDEIRKRMSEERRLRAANNPLTSETRAKMSEAHRTSAKVRAAVARHTELMRTPEMRRAQSERMRRQCANPAYLLARSEHMKTLWRAGVLKGPGHHSEETRRKISDSHKHSAKAIASRLNPERRKKHSEFMKALGESRRGQLPLAFGEINP